MELESATLTTWKKLTKKEGKQRLEKTEAMSEKEHLHQNPLFCPKIIISVETEKRLGGGEPETNSIHFLTYNNLKIQQLKILSEQSLMLPKPDHRSTMANAGLCLHTS